MHINKNVFLKAIEDDVHTLNEYEKLKDRSNQLNQMIAVINKKKEILSKKIAENNIKIKEFKKEACNNYLNKKGKEEINNLKYTVNKYNIDNPIILNKMRIIKNYSYIFAYNIKRKDSNADGGTTYTVFYRLYINTALIDGIAVFIPPSSNKPKIAELHFNYSNFSDLEKNVLEFTDFIENLFFYIEKPPLPLIDYKKTIDMSLLEQMGYQFLTTTLNNNKVKNIFFAYKENKQSIIDMFKKTN